MYRKTNKASKNYLKSYTNRNSDTEQGRFVEPQSIPELRRVIEIVDYDSGEPITHKLELYKTDRIDCYKFFSTENYGKSVLVGATSWLALEKHSLD